MHAQSSCIYLQWVKNFYFFTCSTSYIYVERENSEHLYSEMASLMPLSSPPASVLHSLLIFMHFLGWIVVNAQKAFAKICLYFNAADYGWVIMTTHTVIVY